MSVQSSAIAQKLRCSSVGRSDRLLPSHPTHRVPVNLVAALMMLGPLGNTFVSLEDRLVTVFGILAGLTGVATLIQVGRKNENAHLRPMLMAAESLS